VNRFLLALAATLLLIALLAVMILFIACCALIGAAYGAAWGVALGGLGALLALVGAFYMAAGQP
jgi:hypothetical protein